MPSSTAEPPKQPLRRSDLLVDIECNEASRILTWKNFSASNLYNSLLPLDLQEQTSRPFAAKDEEKRDEHLNGAREKPERVKHWAVSCC